MTHQYIKFELNVCNGSGDNDRKVNDRRKEGRNKVILYAPGISWPGHKNKTKQKTNVLTVFVVILTW